MSDSKGQYLPLRVIIVSHKYKKEKKYLHKWYIRNIIINIMEMPLTRLLVIQNAL